MRRYPFVIIGVLLVAFATGSGCASGNETDDDDDTVDAARGGDSGGGQCSFCAATDACCDGFCVDVRSNMLHCGGCNNACVTPASDGCSNAQCSCNFGPACAAEQRCCPGIGCKDTMTDPLNCGGCGIACGTNETCEAGACVCASTGGQCSGTTCCAGGCADTQTDLDNCGDCGTVCGGTGPTCTAGECSCTSCAGSAFTIPGCCGDGCVDFCNDVNNCGACGMACDPCFLGSCDIMTPNLECFALPMP